MYGCKAAEKKGSWKDRQKLECQWFLSKEIILGHPCIPCARLTRVTIRDGVWEQGGGAGGGGRDRYEAQRVKGGFHVITCNLTVSASHLLVSAVPRIQITVSKSPFLNRVEKYMYCHTISPGSHISWHKGAAHPLPPTVFLLHSPPSPLISHPCVLYCALSACGRIFLVSPIPFSLLFHKEVVVFGGNVAYSICKETSPHFCVR
jgi:hypothetical protein